jgi:hypothetical protein
VIHVDEGPGLAGGQGSEYQKPRAVPAKRCVQTSMGVNMLCGLLCGSAPPVLPVGLNRGVWVTRRAYLLPQRVQVHPGP